LNDWGVVNEGPEFNDLADHQMNPSEKDFSRHDPRAAIRRDAQRIERRERGNRSFWQSLGVLGMVGWPIALGATGGVMLGRWLDLRLQSGIRYTLMLMAAGLLLGCLAAWKSLTQKHD
jgi:ATP synthase protein I